MCICWYHLLLALHTPHVATEIMATVSTKPHKCQVEYVCLCLIKFAFKTLQISVLELNSTIFHIKNQPTLQT